MYSSSLLFLCINSSHVQHSQHSPKFPPFSLLFLPKHPFSLLSPITEWPVVAKGCHIPPLFYPPSTTQISYFLSWNFFLTTFLHYSSASTPHHFRSIKNTRLWREKKLGEDEDLHQDLVMARLGLLSSLGHSQILYFNLFWALQSWDYWCIF